MKFFTQRLFYTFLTFIFSATVHASVNVYAASSMTNVIKTLAEKYQAETGVKVTPVFAGSSSLARQILSGAPVDLYISANTKWSDYLVQQGIINGDAVTNIAHNQLVVISPIGHPEPLELEKPEQWSKRLSGQRLAIGQTNAVPAGMYAKEALESLGLWSGLKGQLAPVNNVRVALTLVERGETPLGIVYKTDALVSDKVKVIGTFPASSHTAITYPMAKLNDKQTTKDFAAYLQSTQAQAVFKQNGFN
ncbi:molybdate ABC transporter substrate-binding protein [Vibrio coralliilyticus]|uniref:molybdate ABC transporter substrate-binding protein n=1 Tax=Vibrio coralliilyticus TaxID=190893 RepID=UPI00148CD6DD|nr:molybdate ABC transporter substrate-binding protein [Vibrio coralliilyticus]NOI29776.1 molybdate ABC transporter substrate-binding protein [Vibrio coralliilyticus]NOI48566.1 molybdate ABC transporter substrate-binding protein [Vibrio coralliilyticus]